MITQARAERPLHRPFWACDSGISFPCLGTVFSWVKTSRQLLSSCLGYHRLYSPAKAPRV